MIRRYPKEQDRGTAGKAGDMDKGWIPRAEEGTAQTREGGREQKRYFMACNRAGG